MRGKFDTAKLSQSACLLEGLCIYLHRTEGDFAVIIHSYRDCANVFPRGMTNMYLSTPGRFFCTNIRESDVMSGTTMDRLEKCIKVVAEEKEPEIIYVFASCVSELIGDDIRGCASRISEELSMPVVAVTSSGLDDTSQKRIVEWHAELMYMVCHDEVEKNNSAVNILGFPADDTGEIREILESVGITVNAWIDGSSPMSEWKKLPSAALNVVVEKELYAAVIDRMKKENGIESVEAPVPVGVLSTDVFLEKIAKWFGKSAELKKVVSERRESTKEKLKALSQKTAGLEMGFNIGTERNYKPYIVAMDGLGEVGFYKELCFNITLLIQGSPDGDRKLMISKLLQEMNIQATFDIFVDNVSITSALMKKKYALVYCVEFMSDMVRPTGTPMIGIGRLKMGYNGAITNYELVEKTLFSEQGNN